jgi:hypothetical protein
MLEALPAETHPAWELALESVLFGGEGLASGATNYGEQQATRNDFKIADYRHQYGDGSHVREFPTLTTGPPREQDVSYVDAGLRLPVAPDSGAVLPLFVDAEDLPDALALLNEFPTAPAAQESGDATTMLLNAERLPGLTPQSDRQENEHSDQARPEDTKLPPNELADLYDGLYTFFEAMPADAHPIWADAVESVVFGGKYLHADADSYAAQQGDRNGFTMGAYREDYGDGEHVRAFPAIPTAQIPDDDAQHVETDIELPLAPGSGTMLPLDPSLDALPEAINLLAEFSSTPAADIDRQGFDLILDLDTLRADIEAAISEQTPDTTETDRSSDKTTDSGESTTPAEQPDGSTSAPPDTTATDAPASENSDTTASTDSKVLRDETVGESGAPLDSGEPLDTDQSRKYDDADAERAHRRAQQRDPSDVVELGEEIRLTLKQVDYSSGQSTIMGTKNRLVIFVIDAPQDLSEYETIKAKVIDYGGKGNSAEAAFVGYDR